MITLETERLVLRPFREADLDEYARLCSDPEVMRFVGGQPMNKLDAWRSIAGILGHWQLRGYGLWAAEDKTNGRLIGRIGLYNPAGWPGLEVGWLLDRSRWGSGFATEGARAALEHAFDTLEARRVISVIDPENLRSIRVAERLGEQLEGKTILNDREVLIYGIERPPR